MVYAHAALVAESDFPCFSADLPVCAGYLDAFSIAQRCADVLRSGDHDPCCVRVLPQQAAPDVVLCVLSADGDRSVRGTDPAGAAGYLSEQLRLHAALAQLPQLPADADLYACL